MRVIGRGLGWAVEDQMLDEMRKAALAGAPLGNEAALVAHQQANPGLVAPARQDGIAHAICQPPADNQAPVAAGDRSGVFVGGCFVRAAMNVGTHRG